MESNWEEDCPRCGGSGTDGKDSKGNDITCPVCHGTGSIDINQQKGFIMNMNTNFDPNKEAEVYCNLDSIYTEEEVGAGELSALLLNQLMSVFEGELNADA